MRIISQLGRATAWMAVVGLVFPLPCRGAESGSQLAGRPSAPPRHQPSLITDVSLLADGVLQGQVVDAEGSPLPQVTVRVYRSGQLAGSATTSASGQFLIGSLQGGVYQVSAASVRGLVRLWAYGTAPPRAKTQLWVVCGPVTRAQMYPASAILGSPLLVTGLVAAAIAVPVAIHNNRTERENGS